MAIYVQAVDLMDPALQITEAHCSGADQFVNAALRERGIDPNDVSLPNSLLTEIAANWAKGLSGIEGAIGDESRLIEKAREYQKTAERLLCGISREALGLPVPSGTGFGNVQLGRA